jgi:hypothetical protein
MEMYVICAVLGVAGAGLAWRLPASGMLALAASLVPAVGMGLGMAFC